MMSGRDSKLCEQHIPPAKCGFGFMRGGCVPLICFLLLEAVTAFSQTPPAPKTIRVVMDNLSTHSAGALYDTFPAPEARRVLKRLQFHHTPKHASWLNMVEIEIGVLRSQCLDRRIDDKKTILAELAAWQQRRNAEGAQIKWMFTTEKARQKLRKAYPVKES